MYIEFLIGMRIFITLGLGSATTTGLCSFLFRISTDGTVLVSALGIWSDFVNYYPITKLKNLISHTHISIFKLICMWPTYYPYYQCALCNTVIWKVRVVATLLVVLKSNVFTEFGLDNSNSLKDKYIKSITE